MSESSHIFDHDPQSLRELVGSLGMPAFRAAQILQWVYEKGVCDWQQMTNLSRADRDKLAACLDIQRSQLAAHQLATDGTQKLLLHWSGVGETECVMIPSDPPRSSHRRTACISSQVGCPVGCRFCASGLGGLQNNLTTGQIVEQVWRLNQLDDVDRISHVVFMGMGEPLSNFTAVTGALRTLTAEWATHISARRITLSTVGLPAQIRRLADVGLPINLAISLHAPNYNLRRELIPWADYVSIDQLIHAANDFFDATSREVTLEYILLGGVNDQSEHARQLASLTRRMRCNVNLIRYNEVKSLPYQRPATEDVHRFQKVLQQASVNTQLRASRGRDIAAACGQLRTQHTQHTQQTPQNPQTASTPHTP